MTGETILYAIGAAAWLIIAGPFLWAEIDKARNPGANQ